MTAPPWVEGGATSESPSSLDFGVGWTLKGERPPGERKEEEPSVQTASRSRKGLFTFGGECLSSFTQ